MKILKLTILFLTMLTLTNCASGYKTIEPASLQFLSTSEADGIKLEYRYNLLDKKYAKKEIKKGVRLVAVKVTNNSTKDITFGKDVVLGFDNGSEAYVFDNNYTTKTLKQGTLSYLFYLLLTPLNLYTYDTSSYGGQEVTSSTPVGLILGPGLAGGNMIAAGSANKKFETEMTNYNINGAVIKKGETKYGLLGIKADGFDALKLIVK